MQAWGTPVLVCALLLWAGAGIWTLATESVLALLLSAVSGAIALLESRLGEFVCWRRKDPLSETADYPVYWDVPPHEPRDVLPFRRPDEAPKGG